MMPATEFDALVKIPRRDRTDEQNARVRELASRLAPQPAPKTKAVSARVRYAINTVAQAQKAIKVAEESVRSDMGEEAVEGAWSDIVRSALFDAKPSVRDEMLRREGLIGFFE